VQGLMEAEVAGASLLPSLEDLDAFVVNADAALEHLEGLEATRDHACKLIDDTETVKFAAADVPKAASLECNSIAGVCDIDADRAVLRQLSRKTAPSTEEDCDRGTAPSIEEALADRSLCEVSSARGYESPGEVECGESPTTYESTDDELSWPQSKWTRRERTIAGESEPPDILLGAERTKLESEDHQLSSMQMVRKMTQVGACFGIQICMDAEQSEERLQSSPHKVEARPRWVDLSDEEERSGTPTLAAQKAHAGGSSRIVTAAARAMCSECREELGKESFSRRAWRQARGLGGAGLASGPLESAVCRDCSLET